MIEQKRIEKSTTQPQQPPKAAEADQQSSRRRIKVQSDVRAGILEGNGSLYP